MRPWRGTIMHDVGCRRVVDRVFWFVELGLVFSPSAWDENVAED